MIFGQTDVPPNALNNYVRLVRTMNPDAAFQQAFHHSYAEMDGKLRDYMRSGRYRIAVRPLIKVPEFKIEPAATWEVEDALAKVAFAGDRNKEAMAHAKAAIAAAPDVPNGYELLARIEEEDGDVKAARNDYEQAVARHSRDFQPYFELASIRHREIMEEDPTGNSFSPVDARQMANNYERAINLNPRFEGAYASLAAILETLSPRNDQDPAFVKQGFLLFPDDPLIRIGMAVIDHSAGRNDDAMHRLDAVIAQNNTPAETRAYATRLESAWNVGNVFERLEKLREAKKFAEAKDLAAREIASTVDPMIRMQLQQERRRIIIEAQYDAGVSAWEDRRWADARKAFSAIVDSDAPPMAKMQARRRIEELDRRHLGLPKTEGGADSTATPAAN